jgi:Fic family protein
MRSVTVEWHGMNVEAVDPPRIADWSPDLLASTARRTEQAAAAVVRAGDRATGHLEAAARLLLRAEGLASSAIEGLRASAADVAIAEATDTSDTTAAWVADNLAVVEEALREPRPLDGSLLKAWHSRLMRNSTTVEDHHIGEYRDELGWVGGANPKLAAHVAAPHDLIEPAMNDLFAFALRDDVDPVTQAGIVHAHFETIHPFADGNGRLGRVLVGRILKLRLGVSVPPPVSLQMARDAGGYQSGLALYRQDLTDPWITWFADAVTASAHSASDVLAAVDDLQGRWRKAIADLRKDSATHTLLEMLPAHPVVSTAIAAELTGVSRRAAESAVKQLEDRNILVAAGVISTGRGRPERLWIAGDLLALLGR